MPIIGAHVSVAGGWYKCFENAQAIGAEAMQIFGASPRQWSARQPNKEDIAAYKAAEKATGLGPVFLHAAYLVNLGSPNSLLYTKSVDSLVAHLSIAEALGAKGLIYHVGSAKGHDRTKSIAQAVKGMKEVLKKVPGESLLIIENAAGGGDKLGATIEELGILFRGVDHPRVKICLDTQHLFAAGTMPNYSEKEVTSLAKKIEKEIGFEHIVSLHLNDSKTECGSLHDRHENIGEGHIGKAGFVALAKNKQFANLPWLLEVPGFDEMGPDKKNVDIVKRIVQSV